MARVAFQGISKLFGTVRAVDDVSFDIADGEFVCLLGPSGCGKTTTLRMIAGLEAPSEGAIFIGDEDVTNAPPKVRDIGMVFQDYALYPHMTIADNIAYPLKVRGVAVAERRRRAEEVAESLQILPLVDRRPAEISGGQQQRASVARAVVHKPRVFLFDEPLSNLDAKLRLEARSFLKHLQVELGVTAIYVTHDQAEAMALADRIAVMDRGRIVQMGPPIEVYRKPTTTFVANFLGSPPMNLLPVHFKRAEGVLEGDELRVPVGPFETQLQDVDGDSPLTLGLRPEHLGVADVDASGDAIAVASGTASFDLVGDVYALEALGPETLLTVRVGDRLTTARIFGDEPPRVGDRARLRFQPEHMALFDADGRRIERPG